MRPSDPRRQVVARFETDPFPAGVFMALSEDLLMSLYDQWGLTGGCELVELDGDGEPVRGVDQ